MTKAVRDPKTNRFVKKPAAPVTAPASAAASGGEGRGEGAPSPAPSPAPTIPPAKPADHVPSSKLPVTAAPEKKWFLPVIQFWIALLACLGAGCSTVTISDAERGVMFQARVPAWPWQDSMRVIDRMNLSARGTNFTASLRGLSESETTGTNTVEALRALDSILGKIR